jgi:glycine/D-amino acid oxidase-like deaminating enzyme
MNSHPDRHITLATEVRFSDPLPDETDVVIIGGGVLGIFTALYLNTLGVRSVVCEKGRVAGEQSSRNWGWIRQMGRDADELPITTEAVRLWEEIDAQTGHATGFRRCGILYMASSREELDRRAAWLPIGESGGLVVRMIDGKQVAALVNSGKGGKQWAGAMWSPSDARGEPWQAVPAVARLAQSRGVLVRENCAVRGLDIAAGAVGGVHTEAGTIRCGQVLVCGGAWTSLFLRRHGIAIPQLSVHSTVARTGPMPEVFVGAATDEKFAFRRREDGSYSIAGLDSHDLYTGPDAFRGLRSWLPVARESLGQMRLRPFAPKHFPDAWGTARDWDNDGETPFERCRVLDPAPNAARVETLRQRFAERFPELGAPVIANMWAGMIDAMPDTVPVIDAVPGTPGLFVGCGLSGHGFGIGPAFGKILANMMTGRPAGHAMTRFRFTRFTDGSTIRPGPGI